jgi:hypothetical protein
MLGGSAFAEPTFSSGFSGLTCPSKDRQREKERERKKERYRFVFIRAPTGLLPLIGRVFISFEWEFLVFAFEQFIKS